MAETLEIPGPADTEPSERAAGHLGSPFFADLVRTHFAWERALTDGDDTDLERLEAAYAKKLTQFRREEGDIVEVYWCVRQASAVALTTRKQTSWQTVRGDHDIRLHRVSNWLMPRNAQKLVDVLHNCDDLAMLA